jgi:hypothetical protein
MMWYGYLVAPLIVLTVLTVWVAVQHAARAFQQRHPECPAAPEGIGCRHCLMAAGCDQADGAVAAPDLEYEVDGSASSAAVQREVED